MSRHRTGHDQPPDEALLTWAFTQSPQVLALYDTDLRLIRANAEMQRVLGMPEESMRGLLPSQIAAVPEIDEIMSVMRRVVKSGAPQHMETHLYAADGRRTNAYHLQVSPLTEDDGHVRGVCLTAHDTFEQREAAQRLLLINEASTRIGSTLDIARTAQELADVAVPRLADFTSVDLLVDFESGDEPRSGPLAGAVTMRRIAQQSVVEGEAIVAVGHTATYPEHTPPAECLAAGHGGLYRITDAVLSEWAVRDPDRANRMRSFGTHSLMAVPLRARGITLGVAQITRHRRSEPFRPDDLVLAEEITARAAVCIDNARRYTRERITAVTLQHSLLPQGLPRQAALEVATRYLPAGAGIGIGGDWFDVIPLSGARVALVVGDVVGHGLQASATMGRLRTAVRTLADIDLPPEELLTHLDDLVTRMSDEASADTDSAMAGDVGATCLYAVYDPVSRRCSMARAGHPPPAVVSPAGLVEFIDLPIGPPLGLGSLPFEAADLELPEGSVLALYTDGLIETRDSDVDQELEALRTALAQPAQSLEDVCDTVLKDMVPDRPGDDVALLIARTRSLSSEQVTTWELSPDPAIVAQARKDVTRKLASWDLDEMAFTTELVVSELVTNAIRHAVAPIQLRLIRDRTLICEVFDASSTAPHLQRARTYDEGGRGLLMVAQLTQRWGTRYSRNGKCIWAEQSLPTG